MSGIEDLKRIAKVEFAEIVKSVQAMGFKIRIILTDYSLIIVVDFFFIFDKITQEAQNIENSTLSY